MNTEPPIGGQTTWRSLAPFETPYRRDGLRAIAYELVGALGAAPDAVVVPTGHGTAVVGIDRGFRELLAAGLIAASPRLYAAQAAGCAPLAAATAGVPATVEQPDTVYGPVELPNPAGGSYALRVLERTRGAAVAVTDKESPAAATSLTARGVPVSATGGVGVAAVGEIAVAPGETAVVIDPVGPDREADLLRSYLTGTGHAAGGPLGSGSSRRPTADSRSSGSRSGDRGRGEGGRDSVKDCTHAPATPCRETPSAARLSPQYRRRGRFL